MKRFPWNLFIFLLFFSDNILFFLYIFNETKTKNKERERERKEIKYVKNCIGVCEGPSLSPRVWAFHGGRLAVFRLSVWRCVWLDFYIKIEKKYHFGTIKIILNNRICKKRKKFLILFFRINSRINENTR